MDVRRVGEALLRSHPNNLFSAVSRPLSQQRSRLISNRNVPRHVSETSRRTFSSSTPRPQQNAPEKDDSPSSQEQPQQDRKIADPISFGNFLNRTLVGSSANGEMTQRAARGSGSGSNNSNDSMKPKSTLRGDMIRNQAQRGSSLDDAGTQHAAARRASSAKQPIVTSLRELFNGSTLAQQSPPVRSGKWKLPPDSPADVKNPLMEPPDVDDLPRLGPSHGRTVTVYDNDLAGALRRMDMRVNANGIRKAYHAQKFHERPGLKRKRLASLRWRNRFMQGFKSMVQTVKHLKRQGW